MGLLDGQIADLIYQGFKNKLLRGTLTRQVPSGTLNNDGDPVSTTPVVYNVQGFLEDYSDFYRGSIRGDNAGVPDSDYKVNIFAKSLPAGVRPEKDDVVFLGGKYSQLRDARTDPATALWTSRAFEIPEPDNGSS